MRSAIILASVIIHHGLAVKPFQQPMISFMVLFFAVFIFMDIQDFLKKHKGKFKQ